MALTLPPKDVLLMLFVCAAVTPLAALGARSQARRIASDLAGKPNALENPKGETWAKWWVWSRDSSVLRPVWRVRKRLALGGIAGWIVATVCAYGTLGDGLAPWLLQTVFLTLAVASTIGLPMAWAFRRAAIAENLLAESEWDV
jgi:hypothetical protein